MEKIYKSKAIGMHAFLIVFMFITLTFFSSRIYAVFYKSEFETEVSNYDDNTNILVEEADNNTKNEEVKIEEEKEPKDDKETKEITEVKTYTTSDGKKYDTIGKVSIPSLNIEYPILSTTSDELLKVSVTKYWGANPNEVGNMVVLGHNYKTNKFFSKLPNIKIGDTIKITDLSGKTLNYSVYKTDIIDPYDNSCTSQKTNGNIEVTLITCYNNDNNRFVAKARAK